MHCGVSMTIFFKTIFFNRSAIHYYYIVKIRDLEYLVGSFRMPTLFQVWIVPISGQHFEMKNHLNCLWWFGQAITDRETNGPIKTRARDSLCLLCIKVDLWYSDVNLHQSAFDETKHHGECSFVVLSADSFWSGYPVRKPRSHLQSCVLCSVYLERSSRRFIKF